MAPRQKASNCGPVNHRSVGQKDERGGNLAERGERSSSARNGVAITMQRAFWEPPAKDKIPTTAQAIVEALSGLSSGRLAYGGTPANLAYLTTNLCHGSLLGSIPIQSITELWDSSTGIPT